MVRQNKIIAKVVGSDKRICIIEFKKGSDKVTVKDYFHSKEGKKMMGLTGEE